jgi:hypothetical protein
MPFLPGRGEKTKTPLIESTARLFMGITGISSYFAGDLILSEYIFIVFGVFISPTPFRR